MKFPSIVFRAMAMVLVGGISAISSQIVAAEPACRTGGAPLAHAYVRSIPMYAFFYGDLASYISENRSHFLRGGDAVRCAAVLAQAIMNSSIQTFDPNEMRQKQEIDARLGAMGILPRGNEPATGGMSSGLFWMSTRLSRLARALPAAANDNYRPWNTPANDMEQFQIFGDEMFVNYLRDPYLRNVFIQQEALLRQGAEFDFRFVLDAATRLGGAN